MEKAIVYVVAGMSSRFGGKVKQLTEVGENGETFIEISVKQAIKAGFNKIVFVVGNKTETAFKKRFGNSYKGMPVEYAYQYFDETKRDKPWGTTDALCSVIDLIKEPIVFANGDDLYGEHSLKTLADNLENEEDAAVGYKLGKVLPEQGKTNRGVFQTKRSFVTEIKEVFEIEKDKLKERNLTEESLCSMNLFLLHPKTLSLLKEKLDKLKKANQEDRKIESLLPKDLSELIQQRKIKMKIYPTEDKWIGITNPGDEIKVREFLKNT